MDPFAKVRELARAKHAEGIAALVTNWRAIDLVKVLASKAGLELYGLDAKDALLNGALAVLARGDGAIYHIKNASEEDLAVLIGHELGHFHVHTSESGSTCSVHDVDVSTPTEASPVGVDRVAGYGAKERRELQANVFARELLFPRSHARAMYLEQGKTPEAMAREFGLPLPVSRQQLIDALLIPEETASAKPPVRTDPPLDPCQTEAAQFSGAPFLLEAGPGTGKTRTLVARIVQLIERGAAPSSILALTFSNKAAQELAERVTIAAPDAAANIWTGTFHAFGLEFVRKHYDHPKLGYPPDVGIVDRSDAVGLLEDLLPVLPLNHYKNYWDPTIYLRDILAAISRAKDELVDPERYRLLAQAMRGKATDEEDQDRKAAQKALEVAEVYARYEEVLRIQQVLDFGDLIMKPTLVLEGDPALRAALQLQYRSVLVDEYQDVNRASARLLKALAGDASGLWVVGDARQSIYRFCGASSANMARFEVDFPGAKKLSLGKNYRSTQEITDVYCAFSREMAASRNMLELKLEAHRGSGGAVPELRQVEENEEEAAAAASVKELEAAGVALRGQAMLFRTNGKLSEFAAALEARGIPVLHLGSLFERDEIRDLLSLLSLLVDPRGSALIRVAASQRYGIPLSDVTKFLAKRRETEAKALDALKDMAFQEGLSDAGKAGLARLASDLEGLKASSMPWDALCTYLFERSHSMKGLVASQDVRDQMKCVAIWQFLNFSREPAFQGKGPPIFLLLERIRRLVMLNDERDLRQIPAAAQHTNAVRMLTMHGAKGLEFEAVHIPCMTRTRVPLSGRAMACPPPDGMVEEAASASGEDYVRQVREAEEECLYFVAMSRARSHLRHYGSARRPSDFLGKVSPPLLAVRTAALAASLEAPNDWISATTGELGPVEADWLKSFENCPRRFLYTHVLGLPGRQRESPFLKAHDCVYDTLRAAKEHGGVPDKAWLLAQLEESWKKHGPMEHPYHADYRRIAEETISNFHTACQGVELQKVETLAVDLSGTVLVNPDQVALRADGATVLRRIRTGKAKDPKKEEDEWIYTLYHLSGTKRYGAGKYAVEVVYLTGYACTPIAPSTKKMNFRKERVTQTMQSIRAGSYTPTPDDFSCPRCPHFFYCPALPEGAVHLR